MSRGNPKLALFFKGFNEGDHSLAWFVESSDTQARREAWSSGWSPGIRVTEACGHRAGTPPGAHEQTSPSTGVNFGPNGSFVWGAPICTADHVAVSVASARASSTSPAVILRCVSGHCQGSPTRQNCPGGESHSSAENLVMAAS